jgi:GTP-binding protein HflX
MIAVVGYTNAGKSTLLNALTGADVIVENKLFATLDPRARRLRLPSGEEAVLTDTVGFIRKLPKDLFTAFRSTFEEAEHADLLLHVVDASDPARDTHIATTETLLVQLGLERVPRLVVMNKADLVDRTAAIASAHAASGIAVSALDASTLGPLRDRIDEILHAEAPPLEVDWEAAIA